MALRLIIDEDHEDVIVMERQPQRRAGYSEQVRDLYFPKGLRNIHQDGLAELGKGIEQMRMKPLDVCPD
jgi:hypothetical protein